MSLTEVEFPPGMSSISYGAFAYCSSLTKIILPASLSSIETAAFSDCTSLAEVALPTSLSSISYGAFANCSSLTKITLPAGIGSIKHDAFSGCTKLVSFILTGSGSLSVIENGKGLVKNGTELIAYPGASGRITIPEGINTIGGYVFHNTGLTEIILPEWINSIGIYSFNGCTKLISLVSLNPTPPEARYAINSAPGLRIQVPVGSVAAYKAAPGWENFADRISAIKDNFI